MKKTSLFLILILMTNCFAGQSKILNSVGEAYKKLGLPTFTEYAWVINLINVYNQASGFVRTTNQLVRSYKKVYKEQMELKKKVEDTWSDIKRLYSVINPYDMDTWAVALDRAQFIIWYDCNDILDAYGQKDYLQLTSEYIIELDSVFNYDYRTRRNIQVVDKYYKSHDYDSLENAYILAFDDYRNSTIAYLRVQLQSEQTIINDPTTSPYQKQTAQARYDELQTKIINLEKQAYESSSHKAHMDTLIELTSSLISYNLTQLQFIESKITDFEKAADMLRNQYNDLKDGNINSRPKDDIKGLTPEQLTFSNSKIYGTDPNKVTPPSEPDMKPSNLKSREPSAHDILHLQNAINLVALKQEALFRDLSIIKAKTMTMITISEAYTRESHERQALEHAFDAKLLSVSLEESSK